MADYNSSLPIRTENNGDAVVKVCDASVGSQQLKVHADGSIDTNILTTDIDIRDLTFATDSVDVSNSTNVGVVATDLDIRDLAFATDSVDVSNSTNVGVVATDLDIRDLAAATDSVSAWLKDESGNAFTLANPLPVEISEDPGTPLQDYKDATAIAANASDTHTYTTTSAFKLRSVLVAASGKAKFEVKAGPGGSEVSKAVAFLTAAQGYTQIEFASPVEVASGDNVLVIATNRDNQAQDLYSTIVGVLA